LPGDNTLPSARRSVPGDRAETGAAARSESGGNPEQRRRIDIPAWWSELESAR